MTDDIDCRKTGAVDHFNSVGVRADEIGIVVEGNGSNIALRYIYLINEGQIERIEASDGSSCVSDGEQVTVTIHGETPWIGLSSSDRRSSIQFSQQERDVRHATLTGIRKDSSRKVQLSLCDWLKAVSDWKPSEELAGVVVEKTVESSRTLSGCQTNALITGGIEDSGEVHRCDRDERNIRDSWDLYTYNIEERREDQ